MGISAIDDARANKFESAELMKVDHQVAVFPIRCDATQMRSTGKCKRANFTIKVFIDLTSLT